MIDRESFAAALAKVTSEEVSGCGIGTLSEKLLHRILKLYYEPDVGKHEIELLGSIADIKNDNGIIEIQRASFSYLVPKLEKLLPEISVTVVYPIIARKRIKWIDRDTGEMTRSRATVKGKTHYDCARELYSIRRFLGNENLSIRLLLLDCDEYRYLDGKDATRKKKATKLECIPVDIIDEMCLTAVSDYLVLLPKELGDSFTAAEYLKATGSRSRYTYYGLRLLCDLKLLAREKVGKAYIYSRL